MRSIRPARPTFGEALLDAFIRRLAEQDLSPVTARGYRHDLERFRLWIEADRAPAPLASITTVDLINYREHLIRKERLEATTVNRKIQALKKLFGWARQTGQIKTDVAAELRFIPLGQQLRPPALTDAELQALLRAAGQTRHGLAKRNYALVTVLAETGLRVSELCGLRRDDLDMRERSGQLRVREGKGRKERLLPLNSNARRALRVYVAKRLPSDGDDHVFLSERGGHPLAVRTVEATIAELGRRAHIQRLAVTPHLLRHTFAVRYLKRNPGKLVELAALLGHDSLDTTAMYTRPTAEQLAAGVERSRR